MSGIGRVLAGTCSWTDRSVAASGFYPKGTSTPAARLAYYAELFDTVEIDSTFYAIADQGRAFKWIAGTPRGFSFGVKAYSLFTFHRAKFSSLPEWARAEIAPREPDARVDRAELSPAARSRLFEEFAAPVRMLHEAGKLAYILFQFPPTFHFSKKNLTYLRRVREKCGRMPAAFEARCSSWLDGDNADALLRVLRDENIAYTAVDEPKTGWTLPPVWPQTAEWGTVARFHGRNAPAWTDRGATVAQRFDYMYSREELEEWRPRVEQATRESRDGAKIYMMFNNCVADKAMRSAALMLDVLGLPIKPPRQQDLEL